MYILHHTDADCFILFYCSYADNREIISTKPSHIKLPHYASEKGKIRGKGREVQETDPEDRDNKFH
jgi:hypothetical protein